MSRYRIVVFRDHIGVGEMGVCVGLWKQRVDFGSRVAEAADDVLQRLSGRGRALRETRQTG